MNTNEKTYTKEQHELIADLCATYGIEPDEVVFFTGDSKPLFSYEAACVLANRLADIRDIRIAPENNGFVDSVSYSCELTLPDGRSRSGVGVANVGQTDSTGAKLTHSQLVELASGRAIRSALRIADIDLLKLHNQRSKGVFEFTGKQPSNREILLREVHALGGEAGLIIGSDKDTWKRVIALRYNGVTSSADLLDDELADLASFLRSLTPRNRQKAA